MAHSGALLQLDAVLPDRSAIQLKGDGADDGSMDLLLFERGFSVDSMRCSCRACEAYKGTRIRDQLSDGHADMFSCCGGNAVREASGVNRETAGAEPGRKLIRHVRQLN